MSTKNMLLDYLKSKGAFTKQIHPVVTGALKCISGEVPERLKLSVSLSELITFTSHLRKNIVLHDGTLVPCNAVTFALSGSGTAKDSSMNMVRRALKPGYDIIDQVRKDEARAKAEKMAMLDGKQKEEWLAYYEKPKDLQAGLGTVEGLLKHFHELETGSLGAGSINSSEIGSELLHNGLMGDIIKTVAIAYDLGKIPAKIIKSSENQTDAIDCLPINALLFGSEGAILYDAAIKAKFKVMFSTQLARRSIFSFTPETVRAPNFTTPEELFAYRNKERIRTVEAQHEISEFVGNLVQGTDTTPLPLSEEAQMLFDVYKEYNQLLSLDMNSKYKINQLARRHKQWLALKLSGTYAILDFNVEITEENYIQALNTIELFSDDLMNFEKELVKESYQVFAALCQYKAEDNKYFMDLHSLRELEFIKKTGSPIKAIEELVLLVSSYDKSAVYSACDDGICYEKQVKTDIAGISYLEVSGTKEDRAWQCEKGFEFDETTFDELANLLEGDYAYAGFEFKDGKRNKENVISGTKFLVLDIDKSNITDTECHLMLEGINHHIARTSDGDNEFKFRVLIELDAVVDVPDQQWKYFVEEIGKELGLEIDLRPKSQIYFAYADREVLSELDGEPLATREFINKSSITMNRKPKPVALSTNAQKALLNDPLETFGFAFNAPMGKGGVSLMRAAYYARDLNADHKYIVDLIGQINTYWTHPMDQSKIEATVISQINRWF